MLEGDILDVIGSWSEERQQAAHAAIKEIEQQALSDMQIMPHAHELCEMLDRRGLPRCSACYRNQMKEGSCHLSWQFKLAVRV